MSSDTLALTGATADSIAKPSASELNTELGVSMNMPFSISSLIYGADGAQSLLRNDDVTIGQLTEMRRRDGQARSLYRVITLPIRAALEHHTVVPAEGGEKEAEFIAAMLTSPPAMGGMTVPLDRLVAHMLLAIFDGFAAFEMVYWVPSKGPLKGKIVLRKAAYRPSDTVFFRVDDNGGFDGFQQKTTFQGKVVDVVIDRDRAFYYAANEEENPFYGVSYFSSAFYHYDKKIKLYYVSHLAAQHRAVGSRLGHLPANPDKKTRDAFIRALGDFGLAQAMVVPEGYSVEDLVQSASSFDFLGLIDHHDRQMAKSVLAFFIDNPDSAKLVDFSQPKDDMFLLMLKAIMGEIESVINNHVIPRFIDWNFGSEKYPEFKFGSFTDEEKSAVRTIFSSLAVASTTNTTPEFIFELEKNIAEELGLPIDYDAIEERQKAMAEAEDAAKKASLEALANPSADTQQGADGKPVAPGQTDKKPAPKPLAGAAKAADVAAKLSNPQTRRTRKTKETAPAPLDLNAFGAMVLEDLKAHLASDTDE